MVNPEKVAELFMTAGEAMTRLGQLTHLLPCETKLDDSKGKWTAVEIEMLASAVKNFSTELNSIATIIESRATKQIENQLIQDVYKQRSLPRVNQAHTESTSYQVSTSIMEDIVDQSEEVVTNDVNLFMSTPDHELNVIQFDEKEKSGL